MSSITYREYLPGSGIAPFVECFWTLKGKTSGRNCAIESILPNGRTELIFRLGDPMIRYEGSRPVKPSWFCSFVGQARSAICVQPTGRISIFGLSFRPHGALSLIGQPLAEFTDQVVPVDRIRRLAAIDLEERVLAVSTTKARIQVVERLFADLLASRGVSWSKPVSDAVRSLTAAAGRLRIGALAETLGIGRRRLEQDFLQHIGLSPKMFARVIRFQNVFRFLDNEGGFRWPDAVFDCGYFDQAHLIREFNSFCGQAPTHYFSDSHQLAAHFRKT